LAEGRGGDASALFRPSLAFNLLLDAPLPLHSALAVTAPRPDAQVLFLVPQKRTLLAGTMHLPRSSDTTEAKPTDQEVEDCLAQLRAAIPGFDVRLSNVRRVFAGLLPSRAHGTADLARREVLRDHGRAGGLRGLYSVSGVKYTTASDVAIQVLRLMGFATSSGMAYNQDNVELPISPATEVLIDAERLWEPDSAAVRDALVQTARDEAVQSLDDLVFRRTNWATTELDLERVRKRVAGIAGNCVKLPVSAAAPA
jgi:glycerol-3-phosphate dehydrogenase